MSLLFLAVTYARCRIIKIFNDRQITTTGANNDVTKEIHKKTYLRINILQFFFFEA